MQNNKNTIIIILLVIVILILGYVAFFRQQNVNQDTATVDTYHTPVSFEDKDTSSPAPVTNSTVVTNPPQNNPAPNTTNWKTYTNTQLGFSFKYPSTWNKFGEDFNTTNLSGVIVETDISFNDSVSNTSLLVQYHFAPNGTQLYNSNYADYTATRGWYATGGKQIIVGGKTAIQASSILTTNGRGNTIAPTQRIIVDVLDAKKADIELQFNSLVSDTATTIPVFNQILATFTFISAPALSTTLPQYMGTYQNGWPPVIQTSAVAYSCVPSNGENSTAVQKIINSTTFVDGGAGSMGGDYTYTKANGTGTKTATFKLHWVSCGGYGGPGDPTYDQCKSNQNTFFAGLDTLIASLM